MLETHEDDITHWYFGDQKENLLDWLCVERILDEDEQGTHHTKIIFFLLNKKYLSQSYSCRTSCILDRGIRQEYVL